MTTCKIFVVLMFMVADMACCHEPQEINIESQVAKPFYLKLLEPNEIDLVKSYNELWSQEMIEVGLIHHVGFSSPIAHDKNEGEDYAHSRYFFGILSSDDARYCGYLSLGITDQHAHLENLFLEKQYRGQGAGRLVLMELENIVRKEDVDIISLSVMANNEIAIKLYEKLGYQRIHTFDVNQETGYYFIKSILSNET